MTILESIKAKLLNEAKPKTIPMTSKNHPWADKSHPNHKDWLAKQPKRPAKEPTVRYAKEIDTSDPKLHKALENHLGGSFEHFNSLKHSHNEQGHAQIHANVVHSYSAEDLGMHPDEVPPGTNESHQVTVTKHPKEGYKVAYRIGRYYESTEVDGEQLDEEKDAPDQADRSKQVSSMNKKKSWGRSYPGSNNALRNREVGGSYKKSGWTAPNGKYYEESFEGDTKMTVKESIGELVNAIASGDKEQSNDIFQSILSTKLSSAIENLKVDVANQMFNGVNESVEQLDEISVGLAARAASQASDPDYDGKANPDNIARMAGKKFGKKIGDQIGNADKGHYPREYGSQGKQVKGGYDKLSWRKLRSTDPNMTTKAGKLTKTAQKGLKSDLGK